MRKPWRCAVVGAGTAGRSHIRVIPQLSGVATLAAVCDVVPERAQAALEKNNLSSVPVYEDLAALLAKEPNVDVIHLATPSGMHLEHATAAIRAGKHFICEKPLEITLERADQMIALAQQQGVKLAGIFQGRWKDENRAIKRAIDESRFGNIAWAGCFTPWLRPDSYYDEVPWRGTWELDGGGAVMNQGIHAIDLLQWMVGPVETVSAFGGKRIHRSIKTEDAMSCALRFKNGAFGSIVATTAMFPGMPTRIEIGGENGTAMSEDGLKMFNFRVRRPEDQELLSRLGPQAKTVKAPFAGAQANAASISADLHARNISAILNAWSEGREPETCAAEARKAIAIVVAMYESNRRDGAPVNVES
jgi:predicted dehydrogenase